MAESDRDRNLLIGVLAMQMDFISRDQLIDALQHWLSHRERNLEHQLLEQQVIDEAKCQFLSDLAQRHLELHEQSVEKSLASMSSISSIQKAMEPLQESDVTQVFERAKKLRESDETVYTGRDSGEASADDSDETQDLRGGTDISKRFHIIRPHARGGLGIVSIAKDTELNRQVALKEIRPNYVDNVSSRSRFLVEAEVTGRLEHPGIVPVYSLGKSQTGTPFYVMRFIRGNSLKDAIEAYYDNPDQKKNAPDRARQFRDLIKRLVDVCQAIDYAHSRGVLHRDLKPGNIMLGRYGETLVVDWGLAKSIGREATSATFDEETVVPSSSEGSSDTVFGSVVGTLSYMSPEQAQGLIDSLGPPSDVYSLGATLYCILTGESPVEGSSAMKMLDNVREGKFIPIRQRTPNVDPALAAICETAMSLAPEGRYQSAALLMDDLERWLADLPVSAYAEPIIKRATRFAKRHRAWAASILAVIAVSIPGLSIFGLVVSYKNQQLTVIQTDLRDLAIASLDAVESELGSTPGLEQYRNQVMEESFATLDRLHRALPEDKDLKKYLATSARLSANQKARIDLAEEGQRQMERAVTLQREVVDEAEEPIPQKQLLSEMMRDLSSIQRSNGKLIAARESLDESFSLLEELRKLERDDLRLDQTEGVARLADIGLHYEIEEYASALQAAQRSVELLGIVVRRKSKTDADITTWLLARAWAGRVEDDMGNYSNARATFKKAIVQSRSILKQKPGSRNFQYALSRLLHWDARGSARGFPPVDSNHLSLHRAEIEEAEVMLQLLHDNYPDSNGFHAYYAEALADKALIFAKSKTAELELTLEMADKAISTSRKLFANTDSLGNQEILGVALLTKAEILTEANQHESSEQATEEALKHLEAVQQAKPSSRRISAMIDQARNIQQASK